MREYVKYKIWDEMDPVRPYSRWVLEKMFRLHPRIINQLCKPKTTATRMREWVYYFQAELGLVDDERPDAKYLNPWNAARSDLIAELVPLPELWIHNEPEPHEKQFIRIALKLKPRGDISLWLATYVFGFDREEIKVLIPGTIISETDMGNTLIPLLVSCFRRMNEVRLTGETLSHYHKSRYLLLKYYLDAEYHAINF